MTGLTLPFKQYAQHATQKLKLQTHRQSFANTMRERHIRALSPTARAAFARTGELAELCRQHRATFDPSYREKGLQLLRTLPIPSTDEDPHFVVALRALRAAAYLSPCDDSASGEGNSNRTFALLNHLTKHTYLMDGNNMYLLCRALWGLRHPQSEEVLGIVLPRLLTTVKEGDVTAAEAVTILQTYDRYCRGGDGTDSVNYDALKTAVAELWARVAPALETDDLTLVLFSIPLLATRTTITATGSTTPTPSSGAVDYDHHHEGYDVRSNKGGAQVLAAAEALILSEMEEGVLALAAAHTSLYDSQPTEDRELQRQALKQHLRLLLSLKPALLSVAAGTSELAALSPSPVLLSRYMNAVLSWSTGPPSSPAEVSSGSTPSRQPLQAEELEAYTQVRRMIPQLHRQHICTTCHVLHSFHFYHARGARQLASRAAVSWYEESRAPDANPSVRASSSGKNDGSATIVSPFSSYSDVASALFEMGRIVEYTTAVIDYYKGSTAGGEVMPSSSSSSSLSSLGEILRIVNDEILSHSLLSSGGGGGAASWSRKGKKEVTQFKVMESISKLLTNCSSILDAIAVPNDETDALFSQILALATTPLLTRHAAARSAPATSGAGAAYLNSKLLNAEVKIYCAALNRSDGNSSGSRNKAVGLMVPIVEHLLTGLVHKLPALSTSIKGDQIDKLFVNGSWDLLSSALSSLIAAKEQHGISPALIEQAEKLVQSHVSADRRQD